MMSESKQGQEITTTQSIGVVSATDVSPATSMLNFIAQAVTNPDIDANKLKMLLDMQRGVAADDAKAQFFRALHAAQQEMPRVKKNGTIDLGEKDGKSRGSMRFATWEDVDSVARPIYAKHGFSVTFSSPEKSEQGIVWRATWRHVAGHDESNSMTLPPDTGAGRNPLQAAGSTNSYAKRFLTEDFWNIVREGADDDGKRGGTAYIDAEKIANLKRGIATKKIPEAEFLLMMDVQSLEEIEERTYAVAVNAIKSYKPRPV
jgi:hypothetical protein